MKKSKPYSAIRVKDVQLAPILAEHAGKDLWVGIDVAKEFLLVALCWGQGRFGRPWRVSNPGELGLLVESLKQLNCGRRLVVALEPTGTYGDPLRWALQQAQLQVHRVECKASHDYAEIFDGAPSQHDAKDAMIVAELALQGKSRPWPMREGDERQSSMAVWVDQADDQQRVQAVWTGRLEGLLARHWPEATGILDLTSMTLLRALAEYGCPGNLAADGDAAAKLLQWGGGHLSAQKVEALLLSAASTSGVPSSPAEAQRIRQCAQAALDATHALSRSKRELEKLTEGDATLERVGRAVGKATACVLFVKLGDPGDYSNPRAYVKAAGLNLAERSSGKYIGQLKISKRGPSMVRKWLYLAAVRLLKDDPGVRQWYERKRGRDLEQAGSGPARKGIGVKALTSVMRKLLAALWHVNKKKTAFVASRLFGGKGSGGKAGGPAAPALSAGR
jgi:transposase